MFDGNKAKHDLIFNFMRRTFVDTGHKSRCLGLCVFLSFFLKLCKLLCFKHQNMEDKHPTKQ